MAHREQLATRPGPIARTPSGVLVVGAIASIQFGAALAATLFARVGPAGTVWLRLLFGSLVLLAVARPSLGGRTRAELGLAVAFGLVLGAMNLSFYESVQRIPLGVAVSLEFVGPLTVALLGSRRRLDLLWVALAAVGIVALTRTGGAHPLSGLGVGLALLAGAFWGCYILLNARLGRLYEGTSGLALAMGVATLAVLPFGIGGGGSSLLGAEALLLGGAIGLLSSAIPYTFEVEALRRIAPPVFGVLMSLEPAVAALAGLAVLGQRLAARELLGIGLVVIASVGASRRARSSPLA
ncbi:MAG: EamA family transporter, partial [Solirubrobacteraceae bacterium]